MKHVFLTGPESMDQSVLIQQALDRLGGRFRTLSGFVKIRVKSGIEQAEQEVYITPAGCAPVCDDEHLVGILWEDGVYTGFPEVFDHGGLRVLASFAPDADLIVMDDIGRFEMSAPRYSAALLRLLDGDTPILGVLRLRDTPFCAAVKAHPNVRLIEVTRDTWQTAAQDAAREILS